MIKAINSVLLAVTLAVAVVCAGCTATDFAKWKESPQTQENLAQLQDFAFNAALGYFNGLIGKKGAPVNAQAEEAKIEQTVAAAEAKFPTIPRATIDAEVRAQFKDAKKKAPISRAGVGVAGPRYRG